MKIEPRLRPTVLERTLKTVLGVLLALIATDAWAVVLYKLTDRAGNVTYADAVPKGFDGQVKPLTIDPGQHVAPSPPATRPPSEYERMLRTPPAAIVAVDAREQRIRAARAKFEEARRALDDAQNNSSAEDWIYLGPNNPVGMRRMPRPEYQARLETLSNNLARAQEELRAAERG